MSKNLVIVESPTKAKTITKFLGKDYKITSSYGHLRDLPERSLGVDIEHDFEPKYVVAKDKKELVDSLKKMAKNANMIYFATDEDREGEAISWHLLNLFRNGNKKDFPYKRIVFHEITKKAIQDAIKNPRELDINLVDAQQARRVLDRLVGYKLSPLLWKKVAKGLSAGRVQSVAVRLIVEREREIQNFKPEEYWTVEVNLKKEADKLTAKLNKIDDKKMDKFAVNNEKRAKEIEADLKQENYVVSGVTKKEVLKNPLPPFTTSTLQQEAYNKLGFSSKQTMYVAQALYEGVSIGREQTGLITYMRTDSLNLSQEFVGNARDYIKNNFSAPYLPETANYYKTKSKQAQEAHEAIRPTDIYKSPEEVKNYLDAKQFKLYELIWKRALACQMAAARMDNTGIEIEAGKYTLTASGSVIKFLGWLEVYSDRRQENILPELKEHDKLELVKVDPKQHFTEPPARYNDASLVKKLEELGIGRPSTYAPTIATIQTRNYIKREGRTLVPQDIALVVTDLLKEHFPEIIDFDFTAGMEEELDEIAEGKKKWVPVIRHFYDPFSKNLEQKYMEIDKKELTEEKTDEVCEKCGKPMIIKMSRYGKFLACTGFPDCRNTKSLDENGQVVEETKEEKADEKTDIKCEKCGSEMIIKTGRFGRFLACSAYPKCKNTKALDQDTGVKCPQCGKGSIVAKKTKSRKTFYACDQYPKCRFALWAKPTGKKCEKCGSLMVNAGEGKEKCSNKECK